MDLFASVSIMCSLRNIYWCRGKSSEDRPKALSGNLLALSFHKWRAVELVEINCFFFAEEFFAKYGLQAVFSQPWWWEPAM